MMKVKDKLPQKDWAWVVCTNTCGGGVEYVGETGIISGQGITEHCKVFKCNYPRRSAFSNHWVECRPCSPWDCVTILGATMKRQQIDFGGSGFRGNSYITHGGGGGFVTLICFTHPYIHAPRILLCEQRKLNIMNILLFLFHMQHLAAGGIIFWKSSCAADAVPLLPVSWFSFGRQWKDDSPSQPTWYYFNGTIVDSIV